MISAVGKVKDWTSKDQKSVLGKKIDLQISDGINGYTYSYKVPTGENFRPIQMMQVVEILDVRVMDQMGLKRLLGDIAL